MLPAPAGYFKYQSLRRQYAPQHFKDRLAVASDVHMIQAWIGFFGHPGSHPVVLKRLAIGVVAIERMTEKTLVR